MADEPKRARPGFFRRLVDGFFLGNIHPAVLAPYRRDLPLDNDLAGRRGGDALSHEADRVGRRAGYAMETVGYWTNIAGQIIGEVASAGAVAIAAGRAAQGTRMASRALMSEIESTSKKLASVVAEGSEVGSSSVAGTLMKMRDEAFRITEKLEAQLLKEGSKSLKPTERGEFIDAVLKALARNGIDEGILPKTLRISPAPAAITGERFSLNRIPDFWMKDGTAFDLMTATVRSVASHDRRYIKQLMPDGTLIQDVLPLLYPSRARPLSAGAATATKAVATLLGVGTGVAGGEAVAKGLKDSQRRLDAQLRAQQEQQRLSEAQRRAGQERQRLAEAQLRARERMRQQQLDAQLMRERKMQADRAEQRRRDQQERDERERSRRQQEASMERTRNDERRREQQQQQRARQVMRGPTGVRPFGPPTWKPPVPPKVITRPMFTFVNHDLGRNGQIIPGPFRGMSIIRNRF
jgi:hypothetical protein